MGVVCTVGLHLCRRTRPCGTIRRFTQRPSLPDHPRVESHSSAHQFWPKGQWWFQQDNASQHTGTSRVWFHNHGIDLIDWPAWSPDLNPIEELWNDLKRRVYGRHPKSMDELERFVTEEWAATDLNFIARICRNMPHRLQAVIANNGHKVPY